MAEKLITDTELSVLLTASILIRSGDKRADPDFANKIDEVIFRLNGSTPLHVPVAAVNG